MRRAGILSASVPLVALMNYWPLGADENTVSLLSSAGAVGKGSNYCNYPMTEVLA